MNEEQNWSEDKLQGALWSWAWNTYPERRHQMWAVPNGLHLTGRAASIAKATGLLSGVWDLHVFNRGKFHIIETKIGNSQLTVDRIVNGKKIATLIGPVFSCKLNRDDLKDDNFLEIKVSNSMANRIIDLDKRHVFWKKFNNINFAAKLPQNRDAMGLFDASNWQARISGLEGPVTLTEIE